MKRNSIRLASIAVIAGTIATALSVYAANVRLKGTASVQDQGTTAQVCGRLTGLGNQDVTITLVGSGTTTIACLNPAGNFAAGNPGDVAVGATLTIPASEVKNGNVSFCISTTEPECESAKDCGCPNNNWSATVTDVAFHTLTLVVEQGGQVVLSRSLF